MGQEVRCTAVINGEPAAGKALLESEELIFRGDVRLRLPFAALTAVEVSDGRLSLALAGTTAVFDLGPLAARWAAKIRNPRTLLDKLGVAAGAKVALVDLPDADFAARLAERGVTLCAAEPGAHCDLLFFGADACAALAEIAALRGAIVAHGTLWIVYPRGRREITEGDALAAGRAAGLADTKVARFSETHTALRFVARKQVTGNR